MTLRNWFKGIAAGFIATVVVSALMLVNQRTGLMMRLNPIELSTSPLGWIAHFLIGTALWGSLFPMFDANISGDNRLLKGILFGIGAWVLMMIVGMPIAGVGVFGLTLGMMVPLATLVLHLIYGAVLGGAYGLEHPDVLPRFHRTHPF